MLSPEQIAARMTGLGGSDSAAALGLSRYKSAVDLFLEKRGEIAPVVESAPMRWGQLLEPAIRQEYAERTGRVVRLPTETLRHERLPFILAHPDGITDCRRLYEGKTARFADGWGEEGSDEIPNEYLLQVQHNMLVVGVFVADVAVLIGGSDFRLYEVPADPELQELIVAGESDFWQRVEQNRQPAPDFESAGIRETLRRLYPGTDGKRVVATAEHRSWRQVYDEASAKASVYTAAADAARAHLQYEMGEAALLAFDDGRALRRKVVKRKGYTVEASEYLDVRFVNDKETT
jgi:putative phage-type endonuclease